MNLVDGIIFLCLAWGACRGFSKGLISMVCGFVAFLAGVWLAGQYYIQAAKFLGERLGLESIFTKVFIPFFAGGPAESVPQLPSEAVNTLPGFPPSLWEPVQALQTGISGVTGARIMADSLVKLIAFFLIFALASCLLRTILGLLARFLTGLANVTLLGGVNRMGGLGVGLVTNALFLVVAVGMLTPLVYSLSLGVAGEGFRTALLNNWQSSVLVPYMDKGWGAVAQVLALFLKMV